jgi:hypothetical protein
VDVIDLLGAAAVLGAFLVLRAGYRLIVRALAEPMGDVPCDN